LGTNRGPDLYSVREFEALMSHPAMADAERVRSVPFAIVHGCGIDPTNRKHLEFLVDRGISVVWSPTSNLLLYDDTIDAEMLIQAGVNVALGSDWSPSGTKHVWDEAKLTRFFFRSIGSGISDAEIFRMVTSSAARCIGKPHFGVVAEGAAADLFILRSPIESDSALEVFFSTTDRDVLATMIAGVPIYGDTGYLCKFGLDLQPLPSREGRSVKHKSVHLPGAAYVDLAASIDALEDELKELQRKAGAKHPPGRSNILASADVPYERRMQRLRSRVEWFGWSVRRWHRGGRRPSDDARGPLDRLPTRGSTRRQASGVPGRDRDRVLSRQAVLQKGHKEDRRRARLHPASQSGLPIRRRRLVE
jgi:hypothetical protein